MKTLPLLGAGLFVLTSAVGAFEVPRYVFTCSRLAEAQQEAIADKSPLLLLLADPKKQPT